MPIKRKPVDEQGGCLQKAKRARELAQATVAADGALAAAHCGSAALDSQAAWNQLQKWSWDMLMGVKMQK